ncbi:probable LRR receptor-like serine/threonine-protein kinase At3g47570 [Zingiber officinale]|nr:probable LRR receptor-like serine/threonine-protein kinase At3g47570 [Zingiber officinale]
MSPLGALAALISLLFASVPTKATISPWPEGDGEALLAFKEKLDDGGGTALLSWNQSSHFCTWQGVTCGRMHRERVTFINLTAAGLMGQISPSIGNLSFLRSIFLNNNSLHGGIPSSIGRLRRLRHLVLKFNSLGGEIPFELFNCSELRIISLDSNRFVGSVPPWLGSFKRLTDLYLSNNSLTGVIPTSLANASSLEVLAIYYNHIEGVIPEGLGRLARLQRLYLSANNLTGSIPTSLYNLTSLRTLAMTMNQLSGELPADFGSKLRNLRRLLLGGNKFSGPCPSSITNCSDLETLELEHNNFSGRLPPNIGRLANLTWFNIGWNRFEAQTANDWDFVASLTNCSKLENVYLQSNNFGGSLPPLVANLSEKLRELYMSENLISGSIPPAIGNLVGLETLILSNNHLIGGIPEGIGRLRQLQILELEGNSLSGHIPPSLGNLTLLFFLYASFNALRGTIPETLGRLQHLTDLSLSNNFLDGAIPKEVVDLPFLSHAIDLSSNLLIGPIPLEVGNLRNARIFSVSSNRLEGEMPSTIGDCESLEYLTLDDNLLQGTIPSSLGNIVGLRGLNLSKNNLSGEIPRKLSSIEGLEELYVSHNDLSGGIPLFFQNLSFLYAIDLSFNRLEGPVPTKGVFQSIFNISIAGNNELCGGIQELHLPACPMQHLERKKSKLVPLLTAGSSLCFVLLIIIFVLIYRRKSKNLQSTPLSSGLDTQYPMISYAELSRSTAGFDATNLIGRGSYGAVYKATLDRENRTVAVKVFDLQQLGSSQSFLTECEALNRIRHRNLIKIITCCSSIDLNGDDFKALVFEFMPNKSLDRWLHPQLEEDQHQHARNLSLTQRLNIGIDVAEALDYLHNNCKPPVVHCDLKPSNILLDEEMVAHVGDFGLAKLLPEGMSRCLADRSNSLGLRGTIGYVPPEYGEGSPVSTSGDVYSLGVLLMELLTGKSPLDDMFKDGLTLHTLVETRGALEIVDPASLLHEIGTNSSNSIEECSISLARIGLACTKRMPGDRMCMSDIVAQLRGIRNLYV